MTVTGPVEGAPPQEPNVPGAAPDGAGEVTAEAPEPGVIPPTPDAQEPGEPPEPVPATPAGQAPDDPDREGRKLK